MAGECDARTNIAENETKTTPIPTTRFGGIFADVAPFCDTCASVYDGTCIDKKVHPLTKKIKCPMYWETMNERKPEATFYLMFLAVICVAQEDRVPVS